MMITRRLLALLLVCMIPDTLLAAHMSASGYSMSAHWVGLLSLTIFILALLAVSLEEFIDLRKSKPMLLAAGAIWGLIGWYSHHHLGEHAAEQALRHSLLQYSELMLFILVVMTYINALAERRVFLSLRTWVAHRQYSYRRMFWTTGLVAFFLSPFLDNLSTALLMGAVVLNLERDNHRFVSIACVNVVLACNAGGVYSPFGDITTLMVWQQEIVSTTGQVDFFTFFNLVIPALISYLIPAGMMHFALPAGKLTLPLEQVRMNRGAKRIMALFLLTIATAVGFQGQLGLPATIGMMTGLSYLQFFGFYLKKTHQPSSDQVITSETPDFSIVEESRQPFDVFLRVARAEWDTLLFLCGVILCVSGIGYIGFLTIASEVLYIQWGATTANIAIGIASAFLENIPTMTVVLNMAPDMSIGQWLLVTLTAGIGGSLLSIGSAAGVALMGHAKGKYTFFSHLRWTPAIMLGFFISIQLHLWLNNTLF
jgi:Na+/H+ antiporter NhaD/arsenite permease-like protein